MRFKRKVTDLEAFQYIQGEKPPTGVLMDGDNAYVVTMHGQRVYLVPGDWIAPEPDGEHYYPIKDHVIKLNFIPIGEDEPQKEKQKRITKVHLDRFREDLGRFAEQLAKGTLDETQISFYKLRRDATISIIEDLESQLKTLEAQ